MEYRKDYIVSPMVQTVPEIEIPQHWESVCSELDHIAHMLMESLPAAVVDGTQSYQQRIFCYSLYTRTVTNFRGTIVMVNHGLRTEALTLARSTIESALFLHVLKNDIGFLEELKADNKKNRKGLLAAGINMVREIGADPSFADELNKELDSLNVEGKLTRIEVSDLANRIKRPDLYALYRHLSFHAAHPSVASIYLNFRFDSDGGITLGAIKEGGEELMSDTALFCSSNALWLALSEINDYTGERLPKAKLTELANRIANARMEEANS